VKQLKKDGAPSVKSEVEKLKSLKAELQSLQDAADLLAGPKFPREAFDTMLVRKFFVVPSFEIHGGSAGL
jgi:glycyl-tRNA synthetase